MKSIASLLWTVFLVFLVGFGIWSLTGGRWMHLSIPPEHLLDWVMGCLCFLWLIVILKAPWDLYFQAHEVAFELQRSRERNIAVTPGREDYVHTLRQRLLILAVGAHLLSSLLVATVTYFAGGVVGYYFAAFYLVSTAFRPAVAGYVYLSTKLRSIGQEVRYPRKDVEEIRQKLKWLEEAASLRQDQESITTYTAVGALPQKIEELQKQLEGESGERRAETRELRQRLEALSREFEQTISRLTDNQEVIKGIQAFVRLVSQSSLATPTTQQPMSDR